MVEKFGGDSLSEMQRNYYGYCAALGSRWEALQNADALSGVVPVTGYLDKPLHRKLIMSLMEQGKPIHLAGHGRHFARILWNA